MSIHVYPADYRHHFKQNGLIISRTFNSQECFHSIAEINEYYLKPGLGCPLTTFSNTEILTLILSGGLAHQDNLGNQVILHPADVQLVSAAQDFVQGESNLSDKISASFLQIQFNTEAQQNTTYQKKALNLGLEKNKWQLIASQSGRENSLKMTHDVDIYWLELEKDQQVSFEFGDNRAGWIQLVEGSVHFEELELQLNDGASLIDTWQIHLTTPTFARIFLFDLKTFKNVSRKFL